MRLLIVNNIPSHYRSFMFNTLATAGLEFGVDVTVGFEARRALERPWDPDMYEMSFNHYFASSAFRGGSRELYNPHVFSPGLVMDAVRGRYDWVLFAPLMSRTTWLMALVPLRAKKLLWSESNLDSGRRMKGPAAIFKQLLQRSFSALVCPGDRAVEYVLHFNPELASKPIIWLPNIVDTSRYQDSVDLHRVDRKGIRSSLRVGPSETLVLAVGQLIDRKGFQLLIEAAAVVPGDYRILIAGDGPRRDDWAARVDELGLWNRVIMPGAAEPDELARYLAAADYFVHPALEDPSPLVCVEATVAGLPLALSIQTGNAPESVREDENGFTFDASSQAEVTSALSRILAISQTELANMGRMSRKVAEEEFSPASIARSFFQGLLNIGDPKPNLGTEERPNTV